MKWYHWALIAGILLGLFSWAYDERSDARAIARAEETMEDLRRRAEAAEDSAEALVIVADYWEEAFHSSSGQLDSVITVWREIPVPSPVDTAAILEAFPRVVEAGDSLAAQCERAIADCERAIEAKDVAIAGERSARFRQAERADSLEIYVRDLSGRLEERSSGFRNGILVGAGVTILFGTILAIGI